MQRPLQEVGAMTQRQADDGRSRRSEIAGVRPCRFSDTSQSWCSVSGRETGEECEERANQAVVKTFSCKNLFIIITYLRYSARLGPIFLHIRRCYCSSHSWQDTNTYTYLGAFITLIFLPYELCASYPAHRLPVSPGTKLFSNITITLSLSDNITRVFFLIPTTLCCTILDLFRPRVVTKRIYIKMQSSIFWRCGSFV